MNPEYRIVMMCYQFCGELKAEKLASLDHVNRSFIHLASAEGRLLTSKIVIALGWLM